MLSFYFQHCMCTSNCKSVSFLKEDICILNKCIIKFSSKTNAQNYVYLVKHHRGGDKIHIRTLLQYMVTPNVSCAYIKSVCINKTGQMNHSPGCISVIGCNLCETQMDVFMNT